MGQSAYPVVLTSAMQDGPALTAAAAASMLHARNKPVLPNHYWRENRHWRITASGRISSVITTPGTARFDIRVGGVIVFDSLAILLDTVAAHVNVGWFLEILLSCRIVGSGVASQLFGQGKWTCEDILGVPAVAPKGVLTAILPWNSPPVLGTVFDNALQNAVDAFFTQTAATGSLTCHQFMIEELDKADG